jgi:catechol 2,3-dioxygenase-like lactoylglutathione lyase family enzyme
MLFVADVERSIDFYKYLGFEPGNTFTAEGATRSTWAWLQSDSASLMLAAAHEPIVADQQRVLFYLYTDDVKTAHASLTDKGLKPGPITTPFYAPRGEFKLVDPDGYVLMLTHT